MLNPLSDVAVSGETIACLWTVSIDQAELALEGPIVGFFGTLARSTGIQPVASPGDIQNEVSQGVAGWQYGSQVGPVQVAVSTSSGVIYASAAMQMNDASNGLTYDTCLQSLYNLCPWTAVRQSGPALAVVDYSDSGAEGQQWAALAAANDKGDMGTGVGYVAGGLTAATPYWTAKYSSFLSSYQAANVLGDKAKTGLDVLGTVLAVTVVVIAAIYVGQFLPRK